MLANHLRNRPGEVNALEDVVAGLRVALHNLPLDAVQAARPGQYFSGNLDVADVVNRGGKIDALRLVLRQPQFLRNGLGQSCDASLMAGGVGRTKLHGRGHRFDGLLHGLQKLVHRLLLHLAHHQGPLGLHSFVLFPDQFQAA